MMKRILFFLLLSGLLLPLLGSCGQVDDDFFEGKTWYIVGLCPSKGHNILQEDQSLAEAWSKNVLKATEPRYYIQFNERNRCLIHTENHTWQGTFTYDLSSRKVTFSLTGAQATSDLEKRVLDYLQDVTDYEANNSYMQLNRRSSGFIWLNPAPQGRPLLQN